MKRVEEASIQHLSARQLSILHLLKQQKSVTKSQIATLLNVSEDTTLRDLARLIELKLIKRSGKGKAIRYEI